MIDNWKTLIYFVLISDILLMLYLFLHKYLILSLVTYMVLCVSLFVLLDNFDGEL